MALGGFVSLEAVKGGYFVVSFSSLKLMDALWVI